MRPPSSGRQKCRFIPVVGDWSISDKGLGLTLFAGVAWQHLWYQLQQGQNRADYAMCLSSYIQVLEKESNMN